ncbi:imidazole glycerol phosphate synthase subunit HisH [Nicoliella lavandulae]|uniref:Imidazole glycerol phosphate synthase subunit HisH n=1 Tax=Nicoliella lavandulae TaxID=3082954 RepID=A0ABU8SLU1_9LACO
MIAVIDYKAGNVYNVLKACQKIGVDAQLTADPAEIKQADAVIFPGVGAFSNAMQTLRARNLVAAIKDTVSSGTPFLGICLGMQLLFDSSTEFGNSQGLGLIPGQIVQIPDQNNQLMVPQTGWNQNQLKQPDSIFSSVNRQYTYFTHSYYARCDAKYIVASVDYGVEIPAIVQKDNVYGFQFHPEKSGQVGLQLLTTFFERAGLK